MASSVGDLFIKLGFDVDDTKLKNFDSGIRSLRNGMALIAAEAVGTVYALERIASKSMAAATNVMNLKTQFGIDPKTSMFWETTGHAENPALSTDEIDSSLANLAGKLRDWTINGVPKWVQDYAHMSGTETVEQALEKLRTLQQSNVDPAWKTKIMAEAGINPGLENVLALSRDKQEALFKELHGGYDAEKIFDAAKAVAALDTELTNLSRKLTEQMVPVIKDLTSYFRGLADTMDDADPTHKEKNLEDYWRNKFEDEKKPRRFWNRVGHDEGNYLSVLAQGVKAAGLEITGYGTIDDTKLGPTSMAARAKVIKEMQDSAPKSSVWQLLGYTSEKEMQNSQKIKDFQNRNDSLYTLIKNSRGKTAATDPTENNNSALPIDGQEPVINISPSAQGQKQLIDIDKRMNPENYIQIPDKPDLRSENNIDITIHAPNADAREVAQEVNKMINTYAQFNNSAVV